MSVDRARCPMVWGLIVVMMALSACGPTRDVEVSNPCPAEVSFYLQSIRDDTLGELGDPFSVGGESMTLIVGSTEPSAYRVVDLGGALIVEQIVEADSDDGVRIDIPLDACGPRSGEG